jgi:hypothetical protein
MVMRKKRPGTRKRAPKAVWERGYRGHVYWAGKAKLGKVTLLSGHFVHPKGKYHWEGGGRGGYSDVLEKAKAAVEYAVSVAGKQRDLFE